MKEFNNKQEALDWFENYLVDINGKWRISNDLINELLSNNRDKSKSNGSRNDSSNKIQLELDDICNVIKDEITEVLGGARKIYPDGKRITVNQWTIKSKQILGKWVINNPTELDNMVIAIKNYYKSESYPKTLGNFFEAGIYENYKDYLGEVHQGYGKIV